MKPKSKAEQLRAILEPFNEREYPVEQNVLLAVNQLSKISPEDKQKVIEHIRKGAKGWGKASDEAAKKTLMDGLKNLEEILQKAVE